MSRILAIESAGPVCSAAIFEDGRCVALKESQEKNSHAEHLALFCEKLIEETGAPDAISLDIGPGSYTGLRIGTSLAKGLAYGYGIPVIGLSGLNCLADFMAGKHPESEVLIPCLDARRMEVYHAIYTADLEELRGPEALVVEENSWTDFPGMKLLFGDGADKLEPLLGQRKDIEIIPGIFPSAAHQLQLSFRKFELKEFLDLAYFEPFYLKEFIALTSKKKNHVG